MDWSGTDQRARGPHARTQRHNIAQFSSTQYGQICYAIVWRHAFQRVLYLLKVVQDICTYYCSSRPVATRLRSLLNFAANWSFGPNEGCQVGDWENKVRVWPNKCWKVFKDVQMWRWGGLPHLEGKQFSEACNAQVHTWMLTTCPSPLAPSKDAWTELCT